MQIRMVRSAKRLIILCIAEMLLSCSSISTLVKYPHTIVNTGGFKYHKHLIEAERYQRQVDSRCEQFAKNGPFFCLYDLDSQRSLFVSFSNECMFIQKGAKKQRKNECIGECDNPFISCINEKQVIEEELLIKVPFMLDGRERYWHIFVDPDTILESQIEDITAFLSIKFSNPFLSELQKIIIDYDLFEQLYSD